MNTQTKLTLWSDESGSPIAQIYTETGEAVAVMATEPNDAPQSLANAARLVHCWNCHEELVSALQSIVNGEVIISNKGTKLFTAGDSTGYLSEHDPKVIAARAALAQAKGEA